MAVKTMLKEEEAHLIVKPECAFLGGFLFCYIYGRQSSPLLSDSWRSVCLRSGCSKRGRVSCNLPPSVM